MTEPATSIELERPEDRSAENGLYAPHAPSPAAWAAIDHQPAVEEGSVDVIMPVYFGYHETMLALHRVLAAKNATKFRLIVIDDCSPDPELKRELVELESRGLVLRTVNWWNRGYCISVNTGMRIARGRDVVLLNADTEVFDGWLDRLVKVAHSDPTIGTVTPFSNAATIMGYPYFDRDDHRRLELSPAELDALCAELDQAPVDVPTGVGFCMYVKGACIQDIGVFDGFRFGKGYGEENDFCQRAIAHGWRNVAATNAFVWHWGGRSFRSRKARLLRKAMRTLDRMYPTYHATIQEFLRKDPLAPAREALDLARVRRAAPAPILVDDRLVGRQPDVDRERTIALRERGPRGAWTLAPVSAPLTPNLPVLDPNDEEAARALLQDLAVSGIIMGQEWGDAAQVSALKRLSDRLGVSWKAC